MGKTETHISITVAISVGLQPSEYIPRQQTSPQYVSPNTHALIIQGCSLPREGPAMNGLLEVGGLPHKGGGILPQLANHPLLRRKLNVGQLQVL